MRIKSELHFKRFIKWSIIYLIFLAIYISFIIPDKKTVRGENIIEKSYKDFSIDLSSNKIEKVWYTKSADAMYVYLGGDITSGESYYKVVSPDHESLKLMLLESGVLLDKVSNFKTAEVIEESREATCVVCSLVFICFILYNCFQMFTFEGSPTLTVVKKKGKKRKVTVADNNTTSRESVSKVEKEKKNNTGKCFSDIAGLKEVKNDMKCIVDFLVNSEKYKAAGAKPPKGIILYGPPGTGKTLLAKAVANEADVPFLYMSGSEFIEMYVGVGAKRVRELFARARKESPCIIFIDEIDAIGGTRHDHDNGEDRKTINALLTEMDGFKESENIIVVGATNRIEDLDPALLRPGRFTNKYCVPLPETVEERLEIIDLYAKNKKFDESVSFKDIARETVGFSPAKIEALLNESAIISVQENKSFISKEIIEKAMFKLLLHGHMKEDTSGRRKDELEIVAWHEAGHAVVGYILGKDITKVTIVSSTSGAGGVTFSTPEDKGLHSAEDIKNQVMELYGGRIAEYLLFNEDKSKVTTGASNDIERATSIIRDAIVKYGMSDRFGLINLGHAKVSNTEIMEAQIQMSKEIEESTLILLKENRDKLEEVANKLLEKNTIYQKDIELVFKEAS